MYFEISTSSTTPIYLQIVRQVQFAVSSGALLPDEQLPSVRELALKVRVNPNTVAKAYSELEHAGVIEMRRGMGTFVTARPAALNVRKSRELVKDEMGQVVVDARQLGLEDDQIREVLDERLYDNGKKPQSKGRRR